MPECKREQEIRLPCCLFVFPKCLYKAISRHVSCHAAFKRQSLMNLLPVSLWHEVFTCLQLGRHNYLSFPHQTWIGWWMVFRGGLAGRDVRFNLPVSEGWPSCKYWQSLPDSCSSETSFPVSGDQWWCGHALTLPPHFPIDDALITNGDQVGHAFACEWSITLFVFQTQSAHSFLSFQSNNFTVTFTPIPST